MTQTKHSGPIEFDFGDSWRLRLWLKGKADGDRGFEPFGMACPEHLIAALQANPEVRAEVLDALGKEGRSANGHHQTLPPVDSHRSPNGGASGLRGGTVSEAEALPRVQHATGEAPSRGRFNPVAYCRVMVQSRGVAERCGSEIPCSFHSEPVDLGIEWTASADKFATDLAASQARELAEAEAYQAARVQLLAAESRVRELEATGDKLAGVAGAVCSEVVAFSLHNAKCEWDSVRRRSVDRDQKRAAGTADPAPVAEPKRHQLNEHTWCTSCDRFDPSGPCPGKPAPVAEPAAAQHAMSLTGQLEGGRSCIDGDHRFGRADVCARCGWSRAECIAGKRHPAQEQPAAPKPAECPLTRADVQAEVLRILAEVARAAAGEAAGK